MCFAKVLIYLSICTIHTSLSYRYGATLLAPHPTSTTTTICALTDNDKYNTPHPLSRISHVHFQSEIRRNVELLYLYRFDTSSSWVSCPVCLSASCLLSTSTSARHHQDQGTCDYIIYPMSAGARVEEEEIWDYGHHYYVCHAEISFYSFLPHTTRPSLLLSPI